MKIINNTEQQLLKSLTEVQIRIKVISPLSCVEWHYHNYCVDTIVVISGSADLKCEQKTLNIKQGDVVQIEIKEKHMIKNVLSIQFVYMLIQTGKYDFIKTKL